MADALAENLHADGPHAAMADRSDPFGRLIGSWDIAWFRPDDPVAPYDVTGELHTGRADDHELHLVSTDGDPFLRWRFTELPPDRFVWLGEYSVDEARTWILEERMVATRRAAP